MSLLTSDKRRLVLFPGGGGGSGDVSLAGNNDFTGINTTVGPFSPKLSAMGANAVDVTKACNTYSAVSDATLTYDGPPAAGTRFLLRITADSSDRTITIPSTYSLLRGANITTLLVKANTTLEVMLQYMSSPSARWEIIGDPVPTLGIAEGGTGAVTAAAAYDALIGPETTIASASTTSIGGVTSPLVSITGTTTITSFGTIAAGIRRKGRFTGSLTLTYNVTSLILPGGANITTAAGDFFEAVSLGSGNWVVYNYVRANGLPIVYQGLSYNFGTTSFNPSNATKYYFSGVGGTASTSSARYQVKATYAGTIVAAMIWARTSGTDATSWTIGITVAGGTQNDIAAVASSSQDLTWENYSLAIAVTAGQLLEITTTTPTWGTPRSNVVMGGYLLIR